MNRSHYLSLGILVAADLLACSGKPGDASAEHGREVMSLLDDTTGDGATGASPSGDDSGGAGNSSDGGSSADAGSSSEGGPSGPAFQDFPNGSIVQVATGPADGLTYTMSFGPDGQGNLAVAITSSDDPTNNQVSLVIDNTGNTISYSMTPYYQGLIAQNLQPNDWQDYYSSPVAFETTALVAAPTDPCAQAWSDYESKTNQVDVFLAGAVITENPGVYVGLVNKMVERGGVRKTLCQCCKDNDVNFNMYGSCKSVAKVSWPISPKNRFTGFCAGSGVF